MKLRKCLKHQINSDYVGIAFLGEETEYYKVSELKTDKVILLNSKVINIHAEITKLVVSSHEMPIVVYTLE